MSGKCTPHSIKVEFTLDYPLSFSGNLGEGVRDQSICDCRRCGGIEFTFCQDHVRLSVESDFPEDFIVFYCLSQFSNTQCRLPCLNHRNRQWSPEKHLWPQMSLHRRRRRSHRQPCRLFLAVLASHPEYPGPSSVVRTALLSVSLCQRASWPAAY